MNAARTVTVLVHGLWLHGLVMGLQRIYLGRQGFEPVCYSYPTVRLALTENADRLAQFARRLGAPQIHWVGHSMGGLVILRMLERTPQLPPGRVVLLGVPYGDSYAGRAFGRTALGARMLGRSMKEWLAGDKPVTFSGRDIGIITGSVSIGLGRLVAPGLALPNDGVVAQRETEFTAARDRIALPVNHTGMLLSHRVAYQTAAFLREGRFAAANSAAL